MKIVCDKCHAKYSISDDKLKKGKTLKIKCKKCGNFIIVKPPEEEDDGEATKVVDYGSMQSSASGSSDEKVWYLVIGESEEGPFTIEEIRAKADSGEIDGDVFGWKEGLPDWKKLRDLDEFSAMFADQPAAASAGGMDAGAAPSESMFKRQGLFDDQDDEDDSPRMKGERHEDSVLFNLSNLQALTSSAQPDIKAPKPGYITPSSEGSGLVDIRALSAALDAKQKQEESGDDIDIPAAPVLAQPVVAPVLTPAAPQAPAAGPAGAAPVQAAPGSQKPPWLIPTIAAVSAVVVLAIGAYFMFGGKDSKKEESKGPKVALLDKTKDSAAKQAPAGTDTHKDVKEQAKALDTKEEAKDSKKEEPKVKDTKEEAKDSKKEEPKAKDTKEEVAKASGKGKKSSGSSSKKNVRSPRRTTRVYHASTSPRPSRNTRPVKQASSPSSSSGGGSGCTKVWCLLKDNKPACCAKYKKGASSSSSAGGGCASNPNPKFTSSMARSGMSRVSGAVRRCGSKYQIHGRVKVRVTVTCSGRVAGVSVSGKHAGTPLAACVKKAVRRARFQKFQKPARKTFSYPFIL